MALTCRLFYDPALNRCWCSLDSFRPLLQCLPAEIVVSRVRLYMRDIARVRGMATATTWVSGLINPYNAVTNNVYT